jgi:chromosomal replication initiation ATPase DnaA
MLTDEDVNFIFSGRLDRPTVRSIAESVSEKTHIPLDDLLGYTKRQPVARARQFVMWKANKAGHSLAAIGRALNRDHTTIRHGVREIERQLMSNAKEL